MEFNILGPLEVRVADRIIDTGGRKQRAVLAVLLIDANRVVSLDQLIDQMWGDEPPARATSTLQAYISNLRRALEPDRAPRSPAQVLASQPPGYVLRIDPESVDAVRFEWLAAEGHRLLEAGLPQAARERLTEGLALWRGPALGDFAFEPFALSEANRLETLRLSALEDQAATTVTLGQHAAAVAELERLIAEHPLRERPRGLLMLALYRSGRQAEALRAFSDARRVLAEELGVKPSPELQRLEGEILAQSAGLDWQPPAAEPALPVSVAAPAAPEPAPPATATATAAPTPMPEPPPGPALVGRDEDLARLELALSDAASGRSRLVLVTGDAGIGKTRLLEAFGNRVPATGAVLAWGRCLDERGAPAFWPWNQVLRDLLAAFPADDLRGALGGRAGELAQIVPEVKDLLPEVDPVAAVDPQAARFRLYDSVTAFLKRLAGVRPVVVMLDDLQWADVASVRLLEFLAAELRESRLLVAATYRDTDVPSGHPLAEGLASLVRHSATERLSLRGLAPADVARYIADATGADVDAGVAERVYRRTDGNPFFVAELVRLLASEGRLGGRDRRPDGAAEPAVPVGVRDVIRQRIARLPEDAQTFLVMAAVVGREFGLDVVQNVSGLDDDRVFDLIESALMTQIVTDSQHGFGRYQFAHGLVQETLYSDLTAVRRARLHAAVARAFEELWATDLDAHAAELAHHWQSAGDRPKALAATYRAAVAAAVGAAHEDAAAFFERALTLWGQMPEPVATAATGTDRASLLQDAAESSFHGGAGPRALELIQAAIDETDRRVAPARTAVLLERKGRYCWVAGDTAVSFAAYQEAVDLLAGLGPSPEQARVLASQGQAQMVRARYTDAIATCRQAIEVARQVGARAEEGHARNSLGASLATLGFLDEGIADLEESRRIAVELNRADDECRALANLASRLLQAGRLQAALTTAQAGVASARRHGMTRIYGSFIAATGAIALLRLGRWDEADRVTAEMLDAGPSMVSAFELRLVRATLAIRRANLAEARQLLEETADLLTGIESVNFWGQLLIGRAELALAEGALDDARAAVLDGLDLVAPSDDESCGPELCALGARAEAEAAARSRRDAGEGRAEAAAAAALVAEASRFLERPVARGVAPLPENVGFALLSEAEAARAAGGPQVEQWVAAAEHWEQSGQVFHATYSRMREAQARLGQGEPPDRAWAILRFSARAAAKLGAVGLTITIEDLLAMAESEGSEAAASVAQLESS